MENTKMHFHSYSMLDLLGQTFRNRDGNGFNRRDDIGVDRRKGMIFI